MCESCAVDDHQTPSRWAKARGVALLISGVLAAGVIILHPGTGRSNAATRTGNADRVFVADMQRQQSAGLVLALAGLSSEQPRLKRLARALEGVEAGHAVAGRSVGAAASDMSAGRFAVNTEQRFVAAVREHLQADVLVARVERATGRADALRQAAVHIAKSAAVMLARLR